MAHTRDCAVCGGRFTAQRSTAKYCSTRCRVRATRSGTASTKAEPADAGGRVLELAPPPPPPPSGGGTTEQSAAEGIVSTTEAALRKANRLDTPDGQAALYLAHVLANPMAGMQTGSSIAALIREHRTTLTKALDGANVEETPLDRVRRQRDQRRAGA